MKAKDLQNLIGKTAANKLISKYAGRRVFIPKLNSWSRDQEIYLLRENGERIKALSQRFKLSQTRINQIVRQVWLSNIKRSDQTI